MKSIKNICCIGADFRIDSKYLKTSVEFGRSCFQKDTNDTRKFAAIYQKNIQYIHIPHMKPYRSIIFKL